MITNLLKITSVQKAANIIDHSDIRSIMRYKIDTLFQNLKLKNRVDLCDVPIVVW